MQTIVPQNRRQHYTTTFHRLWDQKKNLWVILSLSFIIGILLLLIAPASGFFHEIGFAAIIASFLGGTIDVYLQQRIAKDAFQGAIGYFLPEDLREAVRYIGSMEWFAEEFSLTIKLETLPNNLLKCTVKVRKFLRNVSHHTAEMSSYLHLDEWGHGDKSRIISCSVKTASSEDESLEPELKDDGNTIHVETKLVPVYPGGEVECLAEGIEIKRLNDDVTYSLAYCARSPKIYVEAPDTLGIQVGLNGAAPLQKHPHTNLYELPGFYLPWQGMTVRWWPKNP